MSQQHKTAKRRFIGRKDLVESKQGPGLDGGQTSTEISTKKAARSSRILTQIPENILNDDELNQAISILPHNYNFEIHKTVWHIRKNGSKRVALQMPEGLLVYACIISDILEQFCQVETVIMGDVTYGACCIDDYTATALECDLLVHYAHSCLVPVDVTKIKTLYIFVTIDFDKDHFLATLQDNFPPGTRLALLGTIQFNTAIHSVHQTLLQRANSLGPDGALKTITVTVPQIRPLSKGEVLGCTAPRIESEDHIDGIVYLGDGRFHLESAMIQNPHLKAYRYDPYSRQFTIEGFDHDEMHRLRRAAIQEARKDYSSHISSSPTCQSKSCCNTTLKSVGDHVKVGKTNKRVGIILGTLGRQGNPALMDLLYATLADIGAEVMLVLLSEIFPGKLAQFGSDIDCWIQIACPRLSIDWGYAFPKPLLTPYEALVAFGKIDEWQNAYPMNFYAKEGLARTKPSIIQ